MSLHGKIITMYPFEIFFLWPLTMNFVYFKNTVFIIIDNTNDEIT